MAFDRKSPGIHLHQTRTHEAHEAVISAVRRAEEQLSKLFVLAYERRNKGVHIHQAIRKAQSHVVPVSHAGHSRAFERRRTKGGYYYAEKGIGELPEGVVAPGSIIPLSYAHLLGQSGLVGVSGQMELRLTFRQGLRPAPSA